FDLFEFPGCQVSHYVGLEYFEQSYADIYDGQSSDCLIGGSAGNSSQGKRDVTAFFFESVLPITETVEVNLTARDDPDSDFGDNIAPAVSARWHVADNIVNRGSDSE
ncbi:TonB-dependent receptor, partial [Pseudoalteromonas sp. S4389]